MFQQDHSGVICHMLDKTSFTASRENRNDTLESLLTPGIRAHATNSHFSVRLGKPLRMLFSNRKVYTKNCVCLVTCTYFIVTRKGTGRLQKAPRPRVQIINKDSHEFQRAQKHRKGERGRSRVWGPSARWQAVTARGTHFLISTKRVYFWNSSSIC